VHTTSIHENYDRALLTVIQLCGVKAPLTIFPQNDSKKQQQKMVEMTAVVLGYHGVDPT
jgi:hypothetical protein